MLVEGAAHLGLRGFRRSGEEDGLRSDPNRKKL